MGAFTARSYTCVYADILDEYVTYAMELVGDILVNTAVPEDDVEQEKIAIQRKIDLVADSPHEQLNAVLNSTPFSSQPPGAITRVESLSTERRKASTESTVTSFWASSGNHSMTPFH